MPDYRTEKCIYPSIFSPGAYIHFGQFIGELLTTRAALKDNKELPLKFWEDNKKWKQFLIYQIKLVSELVKQYRPESIIKALRDKRGQRIYSLAAPYLKWIIAEYERIPELIVDEELKQIEYNAKLRVETSNTKSLRTKLDG